MAFVKTRNSRMSAVLVYKLSFSGQEVKSCTIFITILIMCLCQCVEAQRSSPCHRKCSYVEAFQQANCEYRSLDTIPIECNAASYLSLRYNHITTIEPEIFRGFPFLKYLLLSNNNISHIEANTFIGAPQLKSIKLLYNNLQTFDRYALNGTENRLRNIYLSRNSLRVIENGTFQLVPKLEVIDLYQNHLSQLTSGVFQELKNLERLFLGMNKLLDLPEDIFKDLSSLVYLDLSNNSLSSLTIDLFVHMDHLMTIDLSGNRLVAIGNVLNLPNIRLDLRWNSLRQLDNVTLEILTNNVEILFLEGNPWDCICGLEPLRQWYQQLSISNDENVKIDSPVCFGPSEVANLTIGMLDASLCTEMPAKNIKIKLSAMNLKIMNSSVDSQKNDVLNTDLIFVQENAEISHRDDTRHVKVIVGVVVVFVVLLLLIIAVVIVRKYKKHSEDSNPNKDIESIKPEVGRNEISICNQDHETNICHGACNVFYFVYCYLWLGDRACAPTSPRAKLSTTSPLKCPTHQPKLAKTQTGHFLESPTPQSTPAQTLTGHSLESPTYQSTPACERREKEAKSSELRKRNNGESKQVKGTNRKCSKSLFDQKSEKQ